MTSVTATISRITKKDCAIRKASRSRHRNMPSRNDKGARLFLRTNANSSRRVQEKKAGARTRARYILELCLSSSSAIDKRYYTRTQTPLSFSLSICLLLSLRVSVALPIVVILSFFHFHDPGTELPLPLAHSFMHTHSLSFSPRSHARTKAAESR